MARRNPFRPMAVDLLEERVLLSPGGAITVGALGDSYTDEYRFYAPDRSQARNWVEILAANRLANFGPFAVGGRGEPRNQGFAFNWARSDATSSDMIARQLPGLTAQVASGKVRYAWIFTGGNDFLIALRDAAESGRLQGPGPIAQFGQVEAHARANLARAVGTLLSASPKVKLVVATLPDIRSLPIVDGLSSLLPQSKPLITAAAAQIQAYNTFIRNLAAHNPRIALADLARTSAALSSSTTGSASFGGTTLDLRAPGDDYHHFFLADGIHVGTVVQGVIADTFLAAIHSKFGARVNLLSPSRIVQFARHVNPRTP